MDGSIAMSALNSEISRLLPATQTLSPMAWPYDMLRVTKNDTNHHSYASGYPYIPYEKELTDQFNFSLCEKDDQPNSAFFQTTVYVMYISIFVFALFGNGIVCYIVYSSPRMKTVTNYFIVNLAIGDILMSLFCVPFSFFSTLLLQYWPYGSLLCHLVNYSQAISVLVSAYTLVAISIDRYIAILWPLRPRITKRHAKYIICSVWIIALLTALPIPIVTHLGQPEQWYIECDKYVCGEDWPEPEYYYYYSIALLVLQFVIPLVVLVFTYTRIAFAVWGKKPPGEAENSRDQRMAKSKRKMIKMMVTIVIVFTICWLPFNVLVILITPSNEMIDVGKNTTELVNHTTEATHTIEDAEQMELTKTEFIKYVWFICHWLAMSHCCYNPIIYCYMNARFRIGFLQMLYFIPGVRRCCCINAYTRDRLTSLRTGIALTGIEESAHLHRVNTSTTFISTRRKTNI